MRFQGKEWGGQNGLLAEVQHGYDLTVAQETGCQ